MKTAALWYAIIFLACFASAKACAQFALSDDYWYGPVLYSEGWYCPNVVFDKSCYVRTAASQRVCHVPSSSCITRRWWL
jgi:hypothetical protein